jgi:transcriptional regulator with PAS, ATPase and Fis domain
LLAAHFLKVSSERHGKQISGFDPSILEVLCGLDWPGNVRELQNEIERAVVLAPEGEMVRPSHLSIAVAAHANGSTGKEAAFQVNGTADRGLRAARAQFEASFIAGVLKNHNGNVSRAAITLGISRIGLQKKMKVLGLR